MIKIINYLCYSAVYIITPWKKPFSLSFFVFTQKSSKWCGLITFYDGVGLRIFGM